MIGTHENGWESPGERIATVERALNAINREGCNLHATLVREVKTVRNIGMAMLGLQATILLAIVALVVTLSKAAP